MRLGLSARWIIVVFLLGFGAGQWQQANAPQRAQVTPSAGAALSRHEATEEIHRLARVPGAITLTRHAGERMGERRLSMKDVQEALAKGELREEAHLGSKGDWLYKMYFRRPDDGKQAEIVVAIEPDKLLVITAMWDK